MLQYMVAGMMLEMIVTIIMVKYTSLVNLVEGVGTSYARKTIFL